MISAREIAEDVGVESAFVEKRKKTEIECLTTNQKIKAVNCHKNHNSKLTFFHLVDHVIASVNDRIEQTHCVTEIFNFLLSQENLLQAFNENNILDACKTFYDKLGDMDPFERKEKMGRFVHVINENKESLKTIRDFLNYICKKQLSEVYPNLFIALRVVMTCLISATSAERSFSKLIKIYYPSTTMDDRVTSLFQVPVVTKVKKNCWKNCRNQ